ncbi:alpha/beta fold hydrolase [Kitasatospora cheerisanensis]|nr:alpha/beta fold hydrolase [Kitasatospora cheerisanensis]
MNVIAPSAAGLLERPHATLAFDTAGRTGPLAVHAHGSLSSRAHEQRAGLFDWTPLTATHRLTRYDARGHGRSTGRAVPADYGYPALAEDLLALCDHLSPDEPVTALGASMGAATVLWAALARPERFSRLVLAIPAVAWEARAPAARGCAPPPPWSNGAARARCGPPRGSPARRRCSPKSRSTRASSTPPRSSSRPSCGPPPRPTCPRPTACASSPTPP